MAEIIKYYAGDKGPSYFKNCRIESRPGDPVMFEETLDLDGNGTGLMIVRLDGYIIRPMTEQEQKEHAKTLTKS